MLVPHLLGAVQQKYNSPKVSQVQISSTILNHFQDDLAASVRYPIPFLTLRCMESRAERLCSPMPATKGPTPERGGGFHKWGYPFIAGWFIRENPIEMDDLGVPPF